MNELTVTVTLPHWQYISYSRQGHHLIESWSPLLASSRNPPPWNHEGQSYPWCTKYNWCNYPFIHTYHLISLTELKVWSWRRRNLLLTEVSVRAWWTMWRYCDQQRLCTVAESVVVVVRCGWWWCGIVGRRIYFWQGQQRAALGRREGGEGSQGGVVILDACSSSTASPQPAASSKRRTWYPPSRPVSSW